MYALFIQDDIRISRKLTLNLGLRWDAPLWYHERDNRSGVFDLDKGEYVQLGTERFPATRPGRTTGITSDHVSDLPTARLTILKQ